MRDELRRVLRSYPSLLWLFAGIDLDKQRRPAAAALHLCRKRVSKFRPVDRLYDVEQRHRLPHLVGLQGTDEMQFDIGEFLLQRSPFGLRLLQPAFAEHAMAGL